MLLGDGKIKEVENRDLKFMKCFKSSEHEHLYGALKDTTSTHTFLKSNLIWPGENSRSCSYVPCRLIFCSR